jgi:hypothetical protein
MSKLTIRVPVTSYTEITVSRGIRLALRHLLFPSYANCAPQKIPAIQVLRQETGLGLVEAKRFIDSLTKEILDDAVDAPSHQEYVASLGDIIRNSLVR